MHQLVVAIAAAVLAAAHQSTEPMETPEPSAPVDPELQTAVKKADRHRSIQSSLDLRTTVILVTIGGMTFGFIKDGGELVDHVFVSVHVVICALSALVAAISLRARLTGLDDSTTGDLLAQAKTELATLGDITTSKKKTYNVALGLLVLDFLVVALAVILR